MSSSSRTAQQSKRFFSRRQDEGTDRHRPSRARLKTNQKVHRIPMAIAKRYTDLLQNLGIRLGHGGYFEIALTSCRHGEGVTTVANQLAVCAAKMDTNVLLINAVSSRTILSSVFRLRGLAGFTEFLQQGDKLNTIHDVGIQNLSVMPAGNGILESDTNVNEALDSLREDFELIIVDLGTVHDGPVTRQLAASFETVLMVVSQKTDSAQALEAKQILESAAVNLHGVIENRI